MTMFNMRTYMSALLIASTWVANIKAQQPGQCYYPGHAWANDSRPCDPHAITTQCCPIGWTCFSNFACVVTDLTVVGSSFPLGTTIRGSCTNPLWNDGFCGGFCLNADSPSPSNNGSMENCGGGKWCCAEDASCNCASGKGTFTIPEGVAQTIISVSSLQSTNTLVATSSTVSAKTTSTASTLITTSSASKTSFLSGTSKTAATETAPTTSQTGNSTAHHAPVTDTVGFRAGISVGAVAVAAVLGFLAYCLCCRGRSNRSARDFNNRPSSPTYTAVTEPYDFGAPRQDYTPYNESTAYESPVPPRGPEPYSYSSPPPPLRDPTVEEHHPVTPGWRDSTFEGHRPVTPEYNGLNHAPSMATLPSEGT